jgi:threonylcarbamoyladenosine tRNA methylthiotransferase MtaB
MEAMIGKKERVLIEKVNKNGMAQGYGEHYLPVQFPTPLRAKNIFTDILLENVVPADPPVMTGRIYSFSP